MRGLRLFAVVLAVVALSSVANAQSRLNLTDTPWSSGLLFGFTTFTINNAGTWAAFALELPVEYTFKAGPGDVAAHFGMLLSTRSGFTSIALPIGVRYKIRVISAPLYVYPLLDVGPTFETKGGSAAGMLRVGGGVSYLVHRNIELLFQPLGLGASFDANGGNFAYNFLMGAQARF